MNSLGVLPVFFLAASISSGFMFRLALAMLMVPFSSAAIPTPDPPPETSTFASGITFLYSSAHAWARLTMVSEPLFWMVCCLAASPPPLGSLLPQPVWSRHTARTAAVAAALSLRQDEYRWYWFIAFVLLVVVLVSRRPALGYGIAGIGKPIRKRPP